MNSPANIISGIHEAVVLADTTIDLDWKTKLTKIKTKPCLKAKIVPPSIADAIETIINNLSENKYIFSIVLTACVKKIADPKQDIRIGQENMKNGYSNRSLDQRIVTPFLKRHGYTHCEASGLESGRNLERPLPWDLDYPCNPRGKGNREAFLGILNYIEKEKGDVGLVAHYLMLSDKKRQVGRPIVEQAPLENSIEKIMHVLTEHFHRSQGQGRSRLPVLALYSIYFHLVKEIARYKDTRLAPLERHTTADLRSESIGDIIILKNDQPFEGAEVKSDKPITADMINELPRKFNGKPVNRYYILTTHPIGILPEDSSVIKSAVQDVQTRTGCQVIVNGLIKTLWYYLRLLHDPKGVLPVYQELLKTDPDIRPGIITTWNEIIEKCE